MLQDMQAGYHKHKGPADREIITNKHRQHQRDSPATASFWTNAVSPVIGRRVQNGGQCKRRLFVQIYIAIL